MENKKKVLPGEELAVIEEYMGGKGTYVNSGVVRASTVGIATFDKENNTIEISPLVESEQVTDTGDKIIGKVATVQSSMINVNIIEVNSIKIKSGYSGLILLPKGRQTTRIKMIPDDIVIATVVKNNKGIIFLEVKLLEDGVTETKCSVCGGEIVPMNTRVKCIECGFTDIRTLSSEFEKK